MKTTAQDIELIKKTLREVMRDKDSPASARASAATKLADIIGAGARHASPATSASRPISELSAAELQSEITALISAGQDA